MDGEYLSKIPMNFCVYAEISHRSLHASKFYPRPGRAGTHSRPRRHAIGAFAREATDEGHPRRGSSGAGWARLLAFEGRAKRPSGGLLNERHPPIDCGTDAAKPSANSKLNATSKPAATSIATGSKRETSDEISGRQTLHRHCRPQDQCQPRGCVLERA